MFLHMNRFKKQRAFTLIELMVVVAIIGIMASIAYPSYQDSVRRSRRADAKGVLMSFANAMERRFTETNSYCDVGGVGGASTCGGATNDSGRPAPTFFSATSPLDGTTAYYNLTIVPGSITETTYNLRATAIGAQAGDGNLEINQTESRGRWDRNADGDTDDTDEDTWD